ncbi:MAG: hypothetical protein ACI8P3_002875, partial [Saprospiraceae bacterium]
ENAEIMYRQAYAPKGHGKKPFERLLINEYDKEHYGIDHTVRGQVPIKSFFSGDSFFSFY